MTTTRANTIARIIQSRSWRRRPGPLIRLWDNEFRYIETIPTAPERWSHWMRRQAGLAWFVVRGA